MSDNKVTPLHALNHWLKIKDELLECIKDECTAKLCVFLDYDGTLTPIVSNPDEAFLSINMRDILKNLHERFFVSIVTGRSIPTIRKFVNIDDMYYAGSHGFDIRGPGNRQIKEVGKEWSDVLRMFKEDMQTIIRTIEGASLEDNIHCISVHYRNVADTNQIDEIRQRVDDILKSKYPQLQMKHGKKVFEVSANIKWNKGEALAWMIKNILIPEAKESIRIIPLYIGDDLSDEYAFEYLQEHFNSYNSTERLMSNPLSICVTDEPSRYASTSASFVLSSPQEVSVFLSNVLALKNSNN